MADAELPAPLTPADCDLRGYDFMPLFGNKLFGSKLYGKALRNPRAGLAAIKLWWVAWQQCPAGSLPDDDDDLSMLADFGMDVKGWLKVRDVALHGFIKCSDGRLYHPMLCDEATDAFERRRKERDRKAKMRAAKNGTSAASEVGCPADVPRDNLGTDRGQDAGRDADVRSDRTGQDRTDKVRKADGLLLVPAAVSEPPPNYDPFGTGMAGVKPDPATGRATCSGWDVQIVLDRWVEAARINPATSQASWKTAVGWLDADFEPDDVVAVIKRIASRPGAQQAGSLKFFDSAVRAECKPSGWARKLA